MGRARSIFCLVLAAVCASASGSPLPQEASSSAPAESPSLKAWREGKKALEEHQKLYYPAAFDDGRLIAWGRESALDEDQMETLENLVGVYRAAVAGVHASSGRRLQAAWAGAFEYDPIGKQVRPRPGGELLAVHTERARFIKGFADAEQSLFNTAETMATLETRPLIRAIRDERGEELFGLPTRLPGTDVNLPELLRDLKVDTATTQLQQVLEVHSRKRQELIRARYDTMAAIDRERAELLTDAGAGWMSDAPPAQRDRLRVELEAMENREIASELPIRRHVTSGLESTLRHLLPDDARRIRMEVLDRTHPIVFNDERELEDLLISLRRESDNDAVRAGFSELQETLDRKLAGPALKLVAAADRWQSLAYEHSEDVISRLETEDEMLRIQADRRKTLREGANLALAVLGTDEADARPRIDEYLMRLKSIDRADSDRRAAIAAALAILTQPEPEPPPSDAAPQQPTTESDGAVPAESGAAAGP